MTDNFDFLDDLGDTEPAPVLDLGDRPHVQIRSTTGPSQIVMLDTLVGEPTIANVINNSGLAVVGVAQYQVDGALQETGFTMVDGQTLTIIGNVKGG